MQSKKQLKWIDDLNDKQKFSTSPMDEQRRKHILLGLSNPLTLVHLFGDWYSSPIVDF